MPWPFVLTLTLYLLYSHTHIITNQTKQNMKKLILSIATMMVTSSVFAQSFSNGDTEYTQSFGALGTSCLKTCCPLAPTGGYGFAGGNISKATNSANEITITASATPAPGVAPGHFDFHYTNTVTNGCATMREANIGVDMSSGTPQLIIRAKASVAGATVQFHIASAPNAFPTSTAFLQVPTAQTEKTLTTSYVDYLVNYSGPEWTGASAALKQKINTWSIIIPADNALNNGVIITIESIRIGADISTSNNNANVVNDQVSLFPNPAKGSFKLDMTAMNNSEAAAVKVMNANGVVVSEFTTNNSSEVISTEAMNKGIYLVQITAGNKIATKKVVVE
jgi:Secretion system C-terminal sorting domain